MDADNKPVAPDNRPRVCIVAPKGKEDAVLAVTKPQAILLSGSLLDQEAVRLASPAIVGGAPPKTAAAGMRTALLRQAYQEASYNEEMFREMDEAVDEE